MRSFYAAASLLGVAFASPHASPGSVAEYIRAAGDTPANKAATATKEPCAQISAALAQGASSLDANVALSCLQSVPLDSAGAPTQVLGLQTMVDFQSTLAYLKKPPAG